MASGDTKTEHLLDVLANGSRADIPADNCCNTKTQNYILGAVDRMVSLEEEVEELQNNPDVTDIVSTYQDLTNYDKTTLTDGDVIRVLTDSTHDDESAYYRYNAATDSFDYIGTTRAYTDFVGTSGEMAGAAGLVPAPQATDADKFLKSDGTWATVSGGGGGTSNYNALTNKPSINGVTLIGNKTSSDLGVQDALVSGTNIKTINNQSILGSGNIDIQGDIAVEATARANADTNLQNQITQEAQARAAADTAINGRLDRQYELSNGKSLFVEETLLASGSVGLIWNFNHNVSVSEGTVIDFTLNSYSGSLFQSARIIAQSEDGTRTVLMPVIKTIGEKIRYTLPVNAALLNVQIIRSAIENDVSASYSVVIYDGDDLRTQIYELKNYQDETNYDLLSKIPKVDVEIPDSVLFYNVGYYFNSVTGVMESTGGSNGWIVSDYIPVGYGITVTGATYSQHRPQIVEYDENYTIIGMQKTGAIGSLTKTYKPEDGVAYVRLQSQITTGNIANGTQKTLEPVPMVYHVEKDGSGDYTNLADCIKEATRRKDAVVYVGEGTWDILSELGEDYLSSMSTTQNGVVLKNRVHVICSSKAYIKCLYTGTDANVINYLSAFNAGPLGFTLENADIEVANVRYCVHDERNAETDHYDNYYLNCRMKNTNTTSGSRSQCIGGGLGYDGHIVIDGCTFENPLRENYGIVSYHNAHGSATDSRSLIEVKGCYFKGKNTFRAGYYGNSTVMTQCLVHGNSMGAEPYVTQEDASFTNVNMEIIAWGNEIRSA